MPSVSFAVGCYHRDLHRTRNCLSRLAVQHQHSFNEVLLIQQNCRGIATDPVDVTGLRVIETEDHPSIFEEFGIQHPNPEADVFYDGPEEPHYWPKHLRNPLIAGKLATSDFLLWQDSDITIERNTNPGWVQTAIDQLTNDRSLFVVSPGEGTRCRPGTFGVRTNMMSQQIFLMSMDRFRSINFETQFPYTRHTVPMRYGQPMAQYHYMFEGRAGRYMVDNNLHRLILDGDRWRYWHHGTDPDQNMWTKVL